MVTMWDLRGAGTDNFKASDYAIQMDFPKYDAFVILSSDTFGETDKEIADKAMELGNPTFFAKTKMDSAMKNQKRKLKEEFDKDTEKKKVKQNIKKAVGLTNDDNIFLIVNLPPDDEDLLKDFPDNDNQKLQEKIVKSIQAIQKTAIGKTISHDLNLGIKLKLY